METSQGGVVRKHVLFKDPVPLVCAVTLISAEHWLNSGIEQARSETDVFWQKYCAQKVVQLYDVGISGAAVKQTWDKVRSQPAKS